MVLLKFQIPLSWRQFLAEILGTFLLASLTHGAVAQTLGKNEQGGGKQECNSSLKSLVFADFLLNLIENNFLFKDL